MTEPFFLNQSGLQLLLFGGKGGVGKTTCAAATAFRLSGNSPQKSFLLVSTDPAHSLVDSLAGSPPPNNLETLELDAQECLKTFKGKHRNKLQIMASRGTFLDEEDINRFLDLSLPGLDELMAFLEISRWVEEGRYDCIIVDTAPTGHTLQLLTMPEMIRKWLGALDALLAKHRYMKKIFKGSYKKDDIDEFLLGLAGSVKGMESLLRDYNRCRFIPVMLPEELSIYETLALVEQLEDAKIPVTDVVVNRLYPETACQVCSRWRHSQLMELQHLFKNKHLSSFIIWGIPLYPMEIRGQENLEAFWKGVMELRTSGQSSDEVMPAIGPRVEAAPTLPSPERQLLLFAGKGGVGKTTMACATALRMARELGGREVFLFSTDPAHSLSACLDVPVGPEPARVAPALTAMEIDSQAEFEVLKKQYDKDLKKFLTVFHNLDMTFDREVMERILDLSPPGLDEIMALTKAMEFLSMRSYDFFILDSAPSGHLIRLLELPELIDQWLKVFFEVLLKYRKVIRLPGISKRLVQISRNLKQLRSLLKDPIRSALFTVSILTEMAFQETQDLVAACGRMGVHVAAVFLNLATSESDCPLCFALYRRESKIKEKFQEAFSGIHQTLVYHQDEPRGLDRLTELGQALYQH